ncbi:MAG: CRISPR-associated endonuclease Cas2 [Prevotella sp.]|jgi:CRISPR-associated protein Cas2|nr:MULTISPECIES: CRISPR-associated endonuclease Cas2 [unclassified Prevotella]MCI2125677.1 CRISPR-associated endonuclease Cas2 [Prevotella sp.]
MGKKSTPLTYLEILRKMKKAGIEGSPEINRIPNETDLLLPLQERVDKILGIINDHSSSLTNMIFFVMYDIESNKVRYNIAKYLERMGCIRIQKSIFLADLDITKYKSIRQDLAEVQSLYENHDSIIISPISTDLLKSMTIIGQSINLDIITHSKTTLFF